MKVVTPLGAPPFLMTSTSCCVAATFSGESIVAFEPSSERTVPPAA
jgi:hypothetical protein